MNNVDINFLRCRQADILVQILARSIKDNIKNYAENHPNDVAGNVIDYTFSFPKRIKTGIVKTKREIKNSYISDWTLKDILNHFQLEYEGHGNLYTSDSQKSFSDQIEDDNNNFSITINPQLFEGRFNQKQKEVKRFKDRNNIVFTQSLKEALPAMFPKRADAHKRQFIKILLDKYPEMVSGEIIQKEINVQVKKNLLEQLKYKVNMFGWTIKKRRHNNSYFLMPLN